MKVVHVEAGRHLYGGALQVVFLLRALAAQPGEEHVLICAPGAAIGQAVRALGVRVIELALGGDLDPGMAVRIARVLRTERADLIHLHSRRGADLWGALAGRIAGVPVVLSRRVDNPEPRVWVALKYRLADRVVTISQGIRRVLLAEGVPADKVICVPSAVDTGRYRPTDDPRSARQALEAEFGLPPGVPVIGMAAQFIPRKGHRLLLEALPAVFAQHPDAHFLLFGRGPLAGEVQRTLTARRLEGRVRLPGFRNDLDRWLPALDLLVHPAALEGLGVTLLRAAACGVAIVAGRAGGIPEIVRDGENGRLIDPHDAAALAAALNGLLADAPLRTRMGAAGRAIAERDFSIPAMVAGNRRVYAELLGAVEPSVPA